MSRCKGRRWLPARHRLTRLLQYLASAVFFWAFASTAYGDDQVVDLSVFPSEFDENELPVGWRYLSFPRSGPATSYKMIEDPDLGPIIEARSEGGAGAIVRSVLIDPNRYPVLQWKWKIGKALPKSSLVEKSGDDFPVRLMVSFANYDDNGKNITKAGFRDKTLCYVWAAEEQVGTFAVNPHYDHVVTIVAAAGSSAGSWRTFSRNIIDDFIQAFSEKPEMITGVALMSDSDDTGAQVTGWYGPISLSALDSGS